MSLAVKDTRCLQPVQAADSDYISGLLHLWEVLTILKERFSPSHKRNKSLQT